MTDFSFSITAKAEGERGMVVVFAPDRTPSILTALPTHPAYDDIMTGLRANDDRVLDLFDVGNGIAKRFKKITPRVSWDGTNILWDGDPIHNTLADALGRMLTSGENNYEPLARFWENLEANPVAHSREQAYDWLAAHDFKITEQGFIIGYKGIVQSDSEGGLSWHASMTPGKPSAYVDGVAVAALQKVPNKIGTTVSMPRSEVEHDPNNACSRGLHVATHSYAGSFGRVMEVHVNPSAIVSVPTGASGEKVRVHEYFCHGWADQPRAGSNVVVDTGTTAYAWAGNAGTKV